MSGWIRIPAQGFGPHLSALAQDPNQPEVLHVGTWVGYWRSDDGGVSFRKTGTWSPPLLEMLLTVVPCPKAPKRLYGLQFNGRVVLSEDKGVTWRSTAMRGLSVLGESPKESRFAEGWALACDPNDASKLYLFFLYSQCLWHSADSGETWVQQERGLSGCRGFAVRESRMAPFVVTRKGVKVGARADGRIARIAPGQDTWQVLGKVGKVEPGMHLCVDPHHPTRLWRTAHGRLWRSEDGIRWRRIGPSAVNFVTCDVGKPGRLAILDERGYAAVSSNSGTTWRSLGFVGNHVSLAAFAGDSLVVGAGLYRKQL